MSFCFVYLHAPTDSKTDQRRWEKVQSKTQVRWCTWQVHVRQMFPEDPWGVRKINDQSYLMFETASMTNLPATSGRYIDTEHLCMLIRLKGIVVAGQQAACKDANPIQSKMPRCALTAWLLLPSFRVKELKQQSRVVKTITGLLTGGSQSDVFSDTGLAKKQTTRGWPATDRHCLGSQNLSLGTDTNWCFLHPFSQFFMGLWERRQKERVQNLDETHFIPNYHFLIHHNNHLCIIKTLLIPAKERNKHRHSLLEHPLQKSEQPDASERKWMKKSSTGDGLDGCQGDVTLVL